MGCIENSPGLALFSRFSLYAATRSVKRTPSDISHLGGHHHPALLPPCSTAPGAHHTARPPTQAHGPIKSAGSSAPSRLLQPPSEGEGGAPSEAPQQRDVPIISQAGLDSLGSIGVSRND